MLFIENYVNSCYNIGIFGKGCDEMKKSIIVVYSLILIILLIGCSETKNKIEPHEEEVVGYTTKGTPIIEEPEVDINWKSTPSSTAFSRVGYDEDNRDLYVIFRDSGAKYRYSDFSYSDWTDFTNADSLGKHYNSYIKGQYYCEKID